MTGSIFAGPEAAGGQEVSGARRWPFRPAKTDLQVNKHTEAAQRGDDIIRDGSDFKSRTDRVAQYLLESIHHGGSLPPLSVCFWTGLHSR